MTGKDPGERYRVLTERFGAPVYQRIDAPADREQKARLGKLSASQVQARELAGQPITRILTEAPGNGAAIGGLKVETENGWFAARRPAPRMCTRSTPRASRARRTWRASRRRPGHWWGRCWGAEACRRILWWAEAHPTTHPYP